MALGHRAAAMGPAMMLAAFLVFLALGFAAAALVQMDVAGTVMVDRVAMSAVVMRAVMALVLDLVLVFLVVAAAVMRLAAGFQSNGAASGAVPAVRAVGPVMRHVPFGVTAIAQPLLAAALFEFVLFIFGLFGLFGFLRENLDRSPAAASMPTPTHMATVRGGHIVGCILHVFHGSHRTIPSPG